MGMKKYSGEPDVIVIGGGPAGMMAAGRAAELGAKVLLIEKTYRLGSKLLVTGGGRCNITNTAGPGEFVGAFGKNGRFLYRAFSTFSNDDLMEFFSARGLAMRCDPDGKVFPSDDSAASVLAVLRAYIENERVRILHNTSVTSIICLPDEPKMTGGVETGSGAVNAKKVIIATGGLSYPATGSTGEGYALARQCGHAVVPLRPGLTALVSDEDFIRELQGLTLPDVVIAPLADGRKLAPEKGNLLFTHFGVSGPAVLILSGSAVDALDEGKKVELSVRLQPFSDLPEFERRLQKQLESCGPKPLSNYLADILPESLAQVVERRSLVNAGIKCSMVSREERKRIAQQLTDFRIRITGPRPIEEATITRGGIALDEIDPLTMESRLVAGLYFCGEVIDLAGITGGYNLQEAFSTGYLAGSSAAQK
jgi:predicted Rossmann fold flavoprotein